MGIVILCANKVEFVSIEGIEVMYTGIGDPNQQKRICDVVMRYSSSKDIFLNVGTAASFKHEPGSIVLCSSFKKEAPQSKTLISFKEIEDYSGVVLSVDNFAFKIERNFKEVDCVDMESFYQAEFFSANNRRFYSVKVITDKFDITFSEWPLLAEKFRPTLTQAVLKASNYLQCLFQ